MMNRLAAALALSLLACRPQGSAVVASAGEFRNTHHAVVRGTVLNGRGQPLEAVEVAALRLADPSRGSLAYNRTWTDASGSFTLPVGMIAHTAMDTGTVGVVVRAAALPPRYPRPSPDAYYNSEAAIPVRFAPTRLDPAQATARLVLPVP